MKIHKLIRCMILATVCLFGVAQGAAPKDWSNLFNALTNPDFTTKTEHGSSMWNFFTSSTALKDFEGATPTDIQQFFDTLLEKLQYTSRSDGFFSTDRTELTWQQVDSLITLLNDQNIKNFITTKLPKITINQRKESTENFLSNLIFSLKAQLQIHTNALKTNYISQNSATFIIQGAWEGKASSSKSDSAGTTVTAGGPVIGRVSSSDNLLKSGPATTPPLSPHVQPKDEPAAAPHAGKKIKTTKELKEKKQRLKKAVADAQQELDAARQVALNKKDAAITLAQSRLADAHIFNEGSQKDLEKAQKALDAANKKVSEAKTKKEQAEKNLAVSAAGPASPPAGGGTPLENLSTSLTALKAKLAQLGQSLQALQSGKPIPTPAPKAAVDKAALEQALNNANAELSAAESDKAAAQKALAEAEKKKPAGVGIIATSEKDLENAQAIKINEDPAVIAAQKTLTEAQEKLSKWQAKHGKQKSSATQKKHPKKYTLKNLGKSKGTEDLPKSLKSSHEPKKVKEAGDATENKFDKADSEQWLRNLTLKDLATQNLKEARALLKEAKAVTGLNIQNKKKITQARKHAQQAIREAVAAQTGNLKTFATKAQAAKEAAEHAKKLTTQAGPRRAGKKAQIEPTLQEARDTLARAKGIADVQNDTTVQQAIAAAQTAIQEAAQAHAGTKTKAFRIKAAAALTSAKAAETATKKAKQKLDDDKVAAQAAQAEEAKKQAAAKEKAEKEKAAAAAKDQAEKEALQKKEANEFLDKAKQALSKVNDLKDINTQPNITNAVQESQKAIDAANSGTLAPADFLATAQRAAAQAQASLDLATAAQEKIEKGLRETSKLLKEATDYGSKQKVNDNKKVKTALQAAEDARTKAESTKTEIDTQAAQDAARNVLKVAQDVAVRRKERRTEAYRINNKISGLLGEVEGIIKKIPNYQNHQEVATAYSEALTAFDQSQKPLIISNKGKTPQQLAEQALAAAEKALTLAKAAQIEEAKKTTDADNATKVAAAHIVQDARNIHTQATQVAGVQDKKVVVKAIAAAQTAIDQADAEKDNAQMCTVKAESAKALAQNALNIAQTAAPKRANKKADAERIFNEAKKLLQDAQSIVEVQDDATVKTAIDHASKTLALAQHAHAGTKVKTFKERASAALIAAQQTYNAAREAKQKFDSDQGAVKATATETANEEQGAKAKTITKPKEDLAPGLDKLREKPMRDAKLHGRKRKKRDLSGILIKTPVEEANSLIQEITDIANGVDSTETIKQQAATAKLEFETLKNTVDKDDQQIILNRITDLRTQVLRAAAAEKKHKEIMQENKAKLTKQKAAGANALPGMIAEAKALFDALNAMPTNLPGYKKISVFGKALEPAIINVENKYNALRLAQDDPTDSQAVKGTSMQKKTLEEIKKIYKEIYDKYKAAGGNLGVAEIPAP